MVFSVVWLLGFLLFFGVGVCVVLRGCVVLGCLGFLLCFFLVGFVGRWVGVFFSTTLQTLFVCHYKAYKCIEKSIFNVLNYALLRIYYLIFLVCRKEKCVELRRIFALSFIRSRPRVILTGN